MHSNLIERPATLYNLVQGEILTKTSIYNLEKDKFLHNLCKLICKFLRNTFLHNLPETVVPHKF